MRIISSFHDYYDVIQGYGQDDITWIREQQNMTVEKLDDIFSNGFCVPRLIGVCGKTYKVLKLCDSDSCVYAYNMEQVDAYYKNFYSSKQYRTYLETTEHKYRSYWWWRKAGVVSRHSYVSFFGNLKQPDYSKLFQEYPLFLISGDDALFNPKLDTLGFQRVMDPYTIFQEIRMWLSNKASPAKPIPHIDDKTMAEAKGFNKFSFRKDPSK